LTGTICMASDVTQERASALVDRAHERGVLLRLIGGVAVAIHSPSAAEHGLAREYADVDYIAAGGSARVLDELLGELDYHPDVRFNSLHGARRRLYFDDTRAHQIDMFVDSFEMCHVLPMSADRLRLDSPTIPLAELFLSKAQIVQLNDKDLLDLLALLSTHDIGDGDQETINIARIVELTRGDWGLWQTVIGTLAKIDAALPTAGLDDHVSDSIGERAQLIRVAISDAPKSLKWKARARIGDRVRWYELPEDPRRTTLG
jgi:hypothetical protein